MRMRDHVAMGLSLVGLVCVLVSPLHAAIMEESKIPMPDPTSRDTFGQAVAIGTDVAIVGAAGHDIPPSDAGAAYVIDLATGTSTHKLVPTGLADKDSFGGAVGVSGDVAIVGATGADTGGAAYLFSVTSGGQQHKLSPSDPGSGDAFGVSVGIDGSVAVVGAPKHNAGGMNDAGAAYVFNATTGGQTRKLTRSGPVTGDNFGSAVAVSGNVAIVGAYWDGDEAWRAGAAYLIDVTTGNQLHKLTAFDGAASDEFGSAVAICGGVAIVGAPKHDGSAGAAYVFDVATGGLLFQLTADDAAALDLFGSSVAVCGSAAVVGAPGDDDNGPGSGSAYIFDVTTGLLFDKVLASDGSNSDTFGCSVGVSMTLGIAGAEEDDPVGMNTGSAYIFLAPEPATVALVVLGGLAALVRRKRTA